MFSLFALMAWLTYLIGVSCYPRRAAIVATTVGILAPDFFLRETGRRGMANCRGSRFLSLPLR